MSGRGLNRTLSQRKQLDNVKRVAVDNRVRITKLVEMIEKQAELLTEKTEAHNELVDAQREFAEETRAQFTAADTKNAEALRRLNTALKRFGDANRGLLETLGLLYVAAFSGSPVERIRARWRMLRAGALFNRSRVSVVLEIGWEVTKVLFVGLVILLALRGAAA